MDRITRIRIANVRAIERLELVLSKPITVLIGENGAGKSTILECVELLRKVAEPDFMEQFYKIHRGLPALFRKGATEMSLGVTIEDDEGILPRIDYDFSIVQEGNNSIIKNEINTDKPKEIEIPKELAEIAKYIKETQNLSSEEETWIINQALIHDHLTDLFIHKNKSTKITPRVTSCLRTLQIHVGFDTRPSWAARTYQRPESMRVSTTHAPADRLELLGVNLANAWSELRNEESAHWEHTMDIVRLGLGDHIDTVNVVPDPGGGNIYLSVRIKGLPKPIFASDLSDGQLAWLAFVAMTRLNPDGALLAIDEPELHLHPALLARAISLLSNMNGTPVLISTHSDRVLELIDNPAEALRVCELDGSRATISQLDPDKLAPWLESYGDLGQLRSSGYLHRALVPSPEQEDT